MQAAFGKMDVDSSGEVEFEEFEKWWTSFATDKKLKKQKKIQEIEAAGLVDSSPKPKQLQALLKSIMNLLPTIGLNPRTIECLEDLCPDDDVRTI